MPAYPLLMVGDYAAHKVGRGVVECGHQLAQGLLVELPDRAEHAFLGLARGRHGAVGHLGYCLQSYYTVRCGKQRG